jgi:hypothetical protein
MGSTRCPKCGGEISNNAVACHQCGCFDHLASESPSPVVTRQSEIIPEVIDEPTQSTVPVKLPWFLYGCVCWSLTSAFIGLEDLLKAFGAMPGRSEPLAALETVLVFAGLPLCTFGLLDKYLLRRSHETIRCSWLAWSAGGLFCFGILAINLAAFKSSIDRPPVKTPSAASVQQPRLLVSAGGDVQIALPAGWYEDQEIPPSPKRRLAALSPSEDAAFRVIGREAGDVPLEVGVESIRSGFGKQFNGASVSVAKPIQVDGYAAMQFEVRVTAEGRSLVMLYTVARILNTAYLIQVVVPADKYDSDPTRFRSLVANLHFRETSK